mmetsp:Transcript_4621/g.13969  ORF Transcript_4621/g.13969 Transcript_4621/m.13969 type:complete len:548 (-) Transcript_4621:54-1697(-)
MAGDETVGFVVSVGVRRARAGKTAAQDGPRGQAAARWMLQRRRRKRIVSCELNGGQHGENVDDEREHEEGDSEAADEDEDVWRKLLDGMKERIVSKMKVEMESVSTGEDEDDDELEASRQMTDESPPEGNRVDSGGITYSDKTATERAELAEDEAPGQFGEDGDAENERYSRWEKELEDKLRQMVDPSGESGNKSGDAEVEGEEYFDFSQSESGYGDSESVDSGSSDAQLEDGDPLLESIQASEFQEELDESLKSLDEEADVQKLVGRVYDKFLSKNQQGSPKLGNGKSTGRNTRSVPEPEKPNQLYERVKIFKPGDISTLSKLVSADAHKAMKRSLNISLGNLPEPLFEMAVHTDREGLGQLLFTSQVTGYFLRDGEIVLAGSVLKLGNEEEFEKPSGTRLPEPGSRVEKAVSGTLSWWDPSKNEKTEISASNYIQRLEAEVESLREQYDAFRANGGAEITGRLLEYASLTNSANSAKLSNLSSAAADAFQKIVDALLGRSSVHVEQSVSTEKEYLTKLMIWCLMMGYHIRDIESRLELDKLLADA